MALLERLDAAKMELQTVRATFQYKYGVLIPASVPKDPIGVSSMLVLVGACVLGVGFALFAAVAKGKIILPFRIEGVLPSRALEFCIGNTHWLDALTPPLEAHLGRLVSTMHHLLKLEGDSSLSSSEVSRSLREQSGKERYFGNTAL